MLKPAPNHICKVRSQAKKSKNSTRDKKSVYLQSGLGKQMENWLCSNFFSFWNYSKIRRSGIPTLKAPPKHISRARSQAKTDKHFQARQELRVPKIGSGQASGKRPK